jgi:hypothetical protein
MPDELTAFSWAVTDSGYSWTVAPIAMDFQAEQREERVLTDLVPVSTPVQITRYNPLKMYTGLFRTFAFDVSPTEDGVRSFANKYGLLGGSATKLISLGNGDVARSEPLKPWIEEIATMRLILRVWDAADQVNVEQLRCWIRWDGETGVNFVDDESGKCAWIAHKGMPSEVFEHLRPGDLVTPAKWYFQRKVNQKLEEHKALVQLLWTADLSKLRTHFVPKSLIACLWLQLANAAAGSTAYKRCANCNLWIEVGGTRGSRSDKRFCSPTCKAAKHRKEHLKKGAEE